MAILKGKIKTETGDTLYPETSADKVIGLDEASVTITDSSMSKVSGVSDGLALPPASQMEMLSIKGNTVAWNQLAIYSASRTVAGLTFTGTNSNVSVSGTCNATGDYTFCSNSDLISGHKYLIYTTGKYSIKIAYGEGTTKDIGANERAFLFQQTTGTLYIELNATSGETYSDTFSTFCIDLTLAYPADTPTTLTDPRVQWCIDFALKHPEFASKLVNVGLSALETTGRNLFGGDYIVRQIGGLTSYSIRNGLVTIDYDSSNADPFLFFDIGKLEKGKQYTFTVITLSGALDCYVVDNSGPLGYTNYTFTATNDYLHIGIEPLAGRTHLELQIMLNYGSTALPYEPYIKHTYPLLWNGKSAGSVQDEKLANGKEITRTVLIDLGSLNWFLSGSDSYWAGQYFAATIPAAKFNNVNEAANAICAKYMTIARSQMGGYSTGVFCIDSDGTNSQIQIKDSNFEHSTSGAAAFKTAMSGVYICVEANTPTETDGDPLPNAIAVYQGGTEWQINDGAPATITKNYDISIKDQVLTNVKVDARQEEEIGELKAKPCMDITEPQVDFVAEEWEKGLNLWEYGFSSWSNSSTDSRQYFTPYILINGVGVNTEIGFRTTGNKSMVFTTPSSVSTIGIKHNGSSSDLWILPLDTPCDLKPNTTYTLSFDLNGYNPSTVGGLSLSNIMLVEGSHPYPYQPYNGDIVREKDVNGTLLWENGNPDASFGAQTITLSESLFNFKYLIICSKQFYQHETLRIDKFKVLSVSYASMAISLVTSDGGVIVRYIMVDTATTLNVGEGYQNGVGGVKDSLCPVAIYGTNVL